MSKHIIRNMYRNKIMRLIFFQKHKLSEAKEIDGLPVAEKLEMKCRYIYGLVVPFIDWPTTMIRTMNTMRKITKHATAIPSIILKPCMYRYQKFQCLENFN